MYPKFAFVIFVGVLHHMYAASARLIDDGKIIMPEKKVEYEMPESCKASKQSYCFEKGDQYPQEKVDELVKRFEDDVHMSPPFGTKMIIFGDRSDAQESYCPSRSSSEPIYYIIDKNNRTRVVLQTTHFQQNYTLTWCQKEGRVTEATHTRFLKHADMLKTFKLECVTTKLDLEFFVLNDDLFEPLIEVVRTRDGIPVCCKCRYSK